MLKWAPDGLVAGEWAIPRDNVRRRPDVQPRSPATSRWHRMRALLLRPEAAARRAPCRRRGSPQTRQHRALVAALLLRHEAAVRRHRSSSSEARASSDGPSSLATGPEARVLGSWRKSVLSQRAGRCRSSSPAKRCSSAIRLVTGAGALSFAGGAADLPADRSRGFPRGSIRRSDEEQRPVILAPSIEATPACLRVAARRPGPVIAEPSEYDQVAAESAVGAARDLDNMGEGSVRPGR
jgi:hypothetical protein